MHPPGGSANPSDLMRKADRPERRAWSAEAGWL
jgi:hypothetical protein